MWDPLGLSQNEERLVKYRAAELKHGRVAMAAMLGIITQSKSSESAGFVFLLLPGAVPSHHPLHARGD